MSWATKRSVSVTMEVVRDLSRICCELGGSQTRQVFDLLEKGDHLGVIDFNVDYENAESYDDLVYARQIQGLLKKQDFLELGFDREKVAWEKFKASEVKCAETNRRLRAVREGQDQYPPSVATVMLIAQRKIADILGRLPCMRELDFAFGPGANTSVKAKEASSLSKLSARLECSSNLALYVREFLAEFPLWREAHLQNGAIPVKATCGRLQFVPKDARTYRSIVVEPILNSVYQKGFGTYMKGRLGKHGVNLRDQRVNQELARKGSIDGEIATVDLSSASDTIARELVWELLPTDWAYALEIGTTPQVKYHGEVLQLEKFSSMGNAFTFELESLLFWGLAFGVCQALGLEGCTLSVYGDDIIVPSSAVGLLKTVFDFVGFEINTSKSYESGPFRESCGADWYRGMDVRPFYLKSLVSGQTLFVMHNFFVRHGEHALAKGVLRHIPAHMQLWGPDGYGDGHLIGSHSLRVSRKLKRAGYDGGFFDTFVQLPRRLVLSRVGDWVYPSYSIYVSKTDVEQRETDPFIVRGSLGYRKASIYTLARSIFAPNL